METIRLLLLIIIIYTTNVALVEDFNTSNNFISVNSNEKTVFAYVKTNNLGDNSQVYEIINKTYKKNNIEINYPQIKNYHNLEKLNLINKDLENEALNILDIYIQDGTNIKDINMKIDYEIKLKNDKFMSIVYNGYLYIKGTAYPTSILYTTNINLENSSTIGLSDYANVNDILKKLRDLDNVKVLSNEKELEETQKYFLKGINDDELLSMLKDADFNIINGKVKIPKEGVYTYMHNGEIIISIPTFHAIGDHAEFIVQK